MMSSRRKYFVLELILRLKILGLVHSVLSVNSIATNTCEPPLVFFSFFNETATERKTVPHLYTLNSSNQGEDAIIPYQYFLMTCEASYPIEWVTGKSVPQHHYFSYVLDDESRWFMQHNFDNSYAVKNNQILSETEIFSASLHIGNETLGKPNITNASVLCSPVEENMVGCGETWFTVRKVFDTTNNLELGTSFKIVRQKKTSDRKYEPTRRSCFQWSPSSTSTQNNATMIQCQAARLKEFEFGNRDYNIPPNLDFVSFNLSQIKAPNGLLSCELRKLQDELNILKTEEDLAMYTMPYFYSLSRFCPNEDPTLPHLYFVSNPKEAFNSCLSSEDEEKFLSLCIRNPKDKNNTIYLNDVVTVTCIASIYYFAKGMRVSTIKDFINDTTIISQNQEEQANGSQGYRNITISVVITDTNVKAFGCEAPVRKSRKWTKKTSSVEIKIPVKPSFYSTSNTEIRDPQSSKTYLLCNATGDPLPGISWSRSNDKKIPDNHTILTGNDLSWIASKLYFPQESPKEFHGEYSCTARNRFDTAEKSFVFGDEKGDSSKLPGPWMILTAVGIGASIVMIAFLFLGWKLRQQARNLRLFSKAEIDDFLFGRPELLLGEGAEYEEINSYAAYLPYDKRRFEIKREQLEFDPTDILGSGAYGTVYKGVFKNSNGTTQAVAIKTVNASSDKVYFAALLSEVKIMGYIGKHENVVELVGACTKYLDKRQLFVATEFCSNGDLLSYIQKHRDTFIDHAGDFWLRKTVKNVRHTSSRGPSTDGYCRLADARVLLSPHLLLVWALQISQGMVFLSSKKVVHGDIAGRNILLADDLKPKIGDFGLSKRIQTYSSYVRKNDDVVPWRWMAIESLQFMKYSIKSDVWSFAVVLYEMFSLGQVPYANNNFSELFIVSLCQGERLSKPNFADDKLYNLMLDCWRHSPDERPSFHTIEDLLKSWAIESETKLMKSPKATSTKAKDNFSDAIDYHAKQNFNDRDKSDRNISNEGFEASAAEKYINLEKTNGTSFGISPSPNTLNGYVDSIPSLDWKAGSISDRNSYVDWNDMK